MTNTLNIHQVARMLGRSTKSIRNYLKEGKLTAEKTSSPRGLEYRFDFNTVASFAKSQLNMSVEANIPPLDGVKHVGRPAGTPGGLGELMKMLSETEREKTTLLKELGEFKAQAGYKIGQLESQIKLLEAAKEERDSLASKFSELEKQYKVRDEDARQLLKVKQYYDGKRWWHFWKGKYVMPAHKEKA